MRRRPSSSAGRIGVVGPQPEGRSFNRLALGVTRSAAGRGRRPGRQAKTTLPAPSENLGHRDDPSFWGGDGWGGGEVGGQESPGWPF